MAEKYHNHIVQLTAALSSVIADIVSGQDRCPDGVAPDEVIR
jgi:hypothetical protein